ncbi:MAG: 50S ribosomal protein L7ae, partial [Oscillospiraceae bacterium]
KAYVVLTASDLSEKTKKRVDFFCEDILEVKVLPFTQEELLDITRKPTGVLAIIDENLATLVEKNL